MHETDRSADSPTHCRYVSDKGSVKFQVEMGPSAEQEIEDMGHMRSDKR